MSMKIFNWVQRRFHHGTIKDGLAGNVKKAESITKEADKQALLKQVALVDVLDGWKDGILTIGTLGLDPLIPFNQQNDRYFILESDEEGQEEEEDEGKEEEREIEQYSVDDDYYYDDNVEDEEVNPLICATFDHSFEEIGSDSLHYDVITNSTTIAEHEQRKNKGERITLAELFLEDSDMKRKPDSVEVETEPGNKKPVARAKSGLSFAKKLIRPHVVEDSRPIKKFNQLMRRMLKRKIHPEFDWKGNKTDNQNKSGIMDVHISKGNK
uniref:Protein TILLER ANGLE CONTROL 1 n=1 Tax=Populus davidiana TaxID=266767 RepID=A0A6M2FBZ4_9ROSI